MKTTGTQPDSDHPPFKEILDYLRRHPDAKDTLDGITQWWLLEQKVLWTRAEVKEALAELIARKAIVSRTSSDGKVYYSANLKGVKR